MSSSLVPFATNPDAPALRLGFHLGVRVGGQDHDRQARLMLVHPFHRIESGQIRHREVHQYDVGDDVRGLQASRESTTGFARNFDLIHHLQGTRQRLAEGGMVIHDQHSHARPPHRSIRRRGAPSVGRPFDDSTPCRYRATDQRGEFV